MAVVAAVHAANHAEVVGDFRGVRQQLAEVHAALAVLFKFPRAAEELAAGLVGEAVIHAAAVVHAVKTLQLGLGIGEVHVARAAVHEKGNHGLRLGREMRRLGPEIKIALGARDVRRRGEQLVTIEQPRQRHAANAQGVAGQKLAAGVLGERILHARISFTTLPGWPSVRVCSWAARL